MPVSYRLAESGTVRLLESGSSVLADSSAPTLAAAAAAAPGPSDAALFPDRAWLLPLTETPDADGGTVETFPEPSGPGIACTASAIKVIRRAFVGDQEIGVTPVVFAFAADPGAKKGDLLLWLGRRARLLAPARLGAGPGSPYLAQGEIRD